MGLSVSARVKEQYSNILNKSVSVIESCLDACSGCGGHVAFMACSLDSGCSEKSKRICRGCSELCRGAAGPHTGLLSGDCGKTLKQCGPADSTEKKIRTYVLLLCLTCRRSSTTEPLN